MKKRLSLIAAIVMSAGIIACGNSKEIMTDEKIEGFNLGDTTTIGLRDIKLCNEDLKLFVQFDSIISDSRCPEGANCIWEGNAEVGLAITYNKELEKLKLNTAAKMETSKIAFGYKFELIDLMPYPGSKNETSTPIAIKLVVSKE